MRQRNNYFIQFCIFITMLLYGLLPGMVIMFMLLEVNYSIMDILKITLAFIIVPVVFFAFFSIINYPISLLIKPKLYLYENEFVFKNNSYNYDDIIEIELDLGAVSRTSNRPTQLVLYRRKKEGIVIRNPSLSMIYNVCKKMKNAKFRIDNWKIIILLFILGTFMGIILGIYGGSK